jgi:hypothetical protein
MDELTDIVAVMDKAACVLAAKGADLLADRLKAAATFLYTKSAHANEVKAALQSDIDDYGRAEIRQVELDAITAWNTRAASGGDSASLERRAMEFAREQLQRHVDMLLQECDCEECPECGKLPHECSGTTCAQTCQCTTCDHCSAVDAIDSLAAALGNQQGVGDQ